MEIADIELDDVHEMAEGAIILDGLDNAIIGITEEFGMEPRILYSVNKILDILSNDGMTNREEALEYYYYNIVGGHFGERNPIFLSDHLAD
tara:strand:+ start:549 stop:821 length:273 start_codon:yes stop_codon:yes gene_type:complete